MAIFERTLSRVLNADTKARIMGYAKARRVSFSEIPVIDLAPLRAGSGGGLAAVARQVHQAATNVGFFYIANHRVPPAVIDAAHEASIRFFALPHEEKLRVKIDDRHRGFIAIGEAKMYDNAKVDLKESFAWGLELPADDPDVAAGKSLMGPNNWPDFMPELRTALYHYYEAVLACGNDLLRAFAVGLGLHQTFFLEKYERPLARGSIIYYPTQPPDLGRSQFGVAPHTDYGCITIVWQDASGGLQVRNREGEWIAAPPIEGTFVINIGDLMARWTNGLFASTPHRVVNRSGRARHSMAVFFDPNFDAVVSCPESLHAVGGPTRYEPVTCGAYVLSRFNDAFAYRK